jgi:aromatic ring-cleaving dioxygenase
VTDTDRIDAYHAHVYFRDAREREAAARVRAELAARFHVQLGHWHERPVGPHPLPMYQVAFAPDEFDRIVPWLMLNRAGLTILLHPETGEDIEDHRDRSMWLGERLELDLSVLEPAAESA